MASSSECTTHHTAGRPAQQQVQASLEHLRLDCVRCQHHSRILHAEVPQSGKAFTTGDAFPTVPPSTCPHLLHNDGLALAAAQQPCTNLSCSDPAASSISLVHRDGIVPLQLHDSLDPKRTLSSKTTRFSTKSCPCLARCKTSIQEALRCPFQAMTMTASASLQTSSAATSPTSPAVPLVQMGHRAESSDRTLANNG